MYIKKEISIETAIESMRNNIPVYVTIEDRAIGKSYTLISECLFWDKTLLVEHRERKRQLKEDYPDLKVAVLGDLIGASFQTGILIDEGSEEWQKEAWSLAKEKSTNVSGIQFSYN